MKGQFSAKSKYGNIVFNNFNDIETYCRLHEEQDLTVTIKPTSKLSEKQKMYNYLEGPIIDATCQALRDDGWSPVDEVIAETYLKLNCAKNVVFNERRNESMYFLISKNDMNKQRLLQFINDCLLLLETRHHVKVMSGSEYKELYRRSINDDRGEK